MVGYTCPKCAKEFKQKGHYDRHMARTRPCVGELKTKLENLEKRIAELEGGGGGEAPSGLKFIDLFCGIGGFHQALASLGHTCVLACDIDEKCRQVYKDNYGIEPVSDITSLKSESIPDFDILCGGFPCQPFAHCGKQMGFEDTRGTLFQDVCRILRDKKPKYCILENVKNLKGHDGGRTWAVIHKCLVDSGYNTYNDPIVLSPHAMGVPQHRERVFILGKRKDLGPLPPFPRLSPVGEPSITSILLDDADVPKGFAISAAEETVLGLWSAFVEHFKSLNIKLPSFPIWSDDWDGTYDIKDLPDWKQKFIKQNREFYASHREFLEPWLAGARTAAAFSGAKRKFEWQCGAFKDGDALWNMLFQFRPSGIRVKRPTYSPALVAMAQIAVVGSKRRRLCPREVARLQSFPDSFRLPASANLAYKQFGNSVNVKVVKYVAEFLLR